MGCERLGGPWRVAVHVSMSPDCRKLGLGVREISIAAGTGADVMASGARAAGPALDVRSCYFELYLYMSVNTYKAWDIPWEIPVLMTYPDISLDIAKSRITRNVTYPGISKDKYVYPYLYQPVVFLRWKARLTL